MRRYEYVEFKHDVATLLQKMNFRADCIIAVTRGGLTLAHFLANALRVRDVHLIKAEFYDSDTKRCDVTLGEVPFLPDVKSALIVDEIVDSGKTMECIIEALSSKNPETLFKTAVIFKKQTASFTPDYYLKESDEWIEFFWERP